MIEVGNYTMSKKNNGLKMTRQGVRDLGHTRPKKVELPPESIRGEVCRHPAMMVLGSGEQFCEDCDGHFDAHGNPSV